jgi:2-polyprenyl-3-methyl-5-hydroxy-6-metoxy-1,4-benzoquinol methylase
VFRTFFGNASSSTVERPNSAKNMHGQNRQRRYSSGWKHMLKHFHELDGLRVLDVGVTSPNNINYLTNMGHSIYLSDLLIEATKPEWIVPGEDGEAPGIDVEGFRKENLQFADRRFDAILLWDTVDFLPEPLVAPVLDRLHEVLDPGGLILAFFHTSMQGPEADYYRFNLTDHEEVEMQPGPDYRIRRVYNNRHIERLLHKYSAYKFLLARDNIREVIIHK